MLRHSKEYFSGRFANHWLADKLLKNDLAKADHKDGSISNSCCEEIDILRARAFWQLSKQPLFFWPCEPNLSFCSISIAFFLVFPRSADMVDWVYQLTFVIWRCVVSISWRRWTESLLSPEFVDLQLYSHFSLSILWRTFVFWWWAKYLSVSSSIPSFPSRVSSCTPLQ